MAIRIVSIPIDCTDAELLARFWAAVLGWQITTRGWQNTEHGSDGVSIAPAGGAPFDIDFRWVPDGPKGRRTGSISTSTPPTAIRKAS